MPDWDQIEPAPHILEIDYAVRGKLNEIANSMKREGRKITHLNIGDPAKTDDYDVPYELIGVLVKKLVDGECLHYDDERGVAELRRLIAEKRPDIKGLRGNPLNENDIYIGSGSTELITFSNEALLGMGDNLMIQDPGYPLYPAILSKIHAKPNYYPLDEKLGWAINISELEKRVNERTKGIVIINPNNPTGRNYAREELQEVRRFADRHRLMIFADEVYSHLNYDDKDHVPLATLDGEWPVITFGSLSKNYRAPGLRVGWMIRTDPSGRAEKYWETAISKLAGIRLCSPPLLQYAIMPALTNKKLNEKTTNGDNSFLEKLRNSAEMTFNYFNNPEAGFSCVKPDAAFYAFPRIDLPEGVTDYEFAKDLLEKRAIFVNPGSGFGPSGKGHIRIVFLPDQDTLKKAYDQIIDFKMNFRDDNTGKLKYMKR
jgi:alanine-synthesizing transaminase